MLNPIILKYAIDSIICDRKDEDNECPSDEETYMLVAGYGIFKLLYDLLNTFREVPYARMAANADITIAHDVYDHV